MYAQWEEKVFKVSTPEGIKSIEYSNSIPEPSKDGYDFDGWYTDEECTSIFDDQTKEQAVMTPVTVYAKWDIINYDVGFIMEDGEVIERSTNIESNYEISDSPIIPEKEGYTGYWSTEENGDIAFDLNDISENENVYLVYRINKYNIKFIMPDNNEINYTVNYGESFENKPVPNDLKFGDAVYYSIENIIDVKENLIVYVTVKNHTYIYCIIGGVALASIAMLFIKIKKKKKKKKTKK